MFDYLSILTYSKGSEKARTKAKVDAFGATHYGRKSNHNGFNSEWVVAVLAQPLRVKIS